MWLQCLWTFDGWELTPGSGAVLFKCGRNGSTWLMFTPSKGPQRLNKGKPAPHRPGLLSPWNPSFNLFKPEGTSPDRVLFRTSRISSSGISANVGGIASKRLLKLKSSLFNILKFPKLGGILPSSLLYCKATTFSCFKDPICVGIFPVSWLQHNCRTTKANKFPVRMSQLG